MNRKTKKIILMLAIILTITSIWSFNTNSIAATTDTTSTYYNFLNTKSSDYYFSIVDLDNDGVFELITLEYKDEYNASKVTSIYYFENMKIYTMKNGKVEKIKTVSVDKSFEIGGNFLEIGKIGNKFVLVYAQGAHMMFYNYLTYSSSKNRVTFDTYSSILGYVDNGTVVEYYHNNELLKQNNEYNKLERDFQSSEKVTFYKNTSSNRTTCFPNNVEYKLVSGYSKQLKLHSQFSKDISWTSSNKNVVEVDKKGKLKAKKSGTAKITAKIKYSKRTYKYSYSIKVYNKQNILNKLKGNWSNESTDKYYIVNWKITDNYIYSYGGKEKYKVTNIVIRKNKDIAIYYTTYGEYANSKYRILLKYNSHTKLGKKSKSYTEFNVAGYLGEYAEESDGYSYMDMDAFYGMYKQ